MLGMLLVVGHPGNVLPATRPSMSDRLLLEPLEVLSAALATGRIRLGELRGREVYFFDETRIGTLVAATDAATIALDPDLGGGCIAASFEFLRLATEDRLVLDMTPRVFRAAMAIRTACKT